ncbi:hypothetical protein DFH07DRAFT_969544 [Mycena maculata]|uniref:DUF6534 domain-containing protein n=1 Tax=Mycena maculata TaxID=230809 RepID=A0AAD7HXM6_9AGAR|nr:hypothetical protein DFH07DRAFT_969544 [Mycena maculata]
MSYPILAYNACSLAASWINCMLFMLEIVLIIRYFQKSSRPLLHRLGVGIMFTFDTICTFAVCAQIYLFILQYACQTVFLPLPTLRVVAVMLFTTYGTASLEQLFMCYLYFSLTKNWVISGFLVSSIGLHLGASYASAILILKTESAEGGALLASKIGAIACAATDGMIASALLYTFIVMEKTSAFRVSTRSLLHRLMVIIVTSGAVVASNTLIEMTLLVKGNPGRDPAYSLFFFAQGRVYALTILVNILVGIPGKSTQTANTVITPPLGTVSAVVIRVDCENSNDRRVRLTETHDFERRSELTGHVDMDTPFSPHKSESAPD